MCELAIILPYNAMLSPMVKGDVNGSLENNSRMPQERQLLIICWGRSLNIREWLIIFVG
jgi:hypothetical protein